eukprot:Rhum_TRINITY_DN14705_c6_g1::Rhum_TRINITY_DN14705_c6_g1_i2::g.112209::m.112209
MSVCRVSIVKRLAESALLRHLAARVAAMRTLLVVCPVEAVAPSAVPIPGLGLRGSLRCRRRRRRLLLLRLTSDRRRRSGNGSRGHLRRRRTRLLRRLTRAVLTHFGVVRVRRFVFAVVAATAARGSCGRCCCCCGRCNGDGLHDGCGSGSGRSDRRLLLRRLPRAVLAHLRVVGVRRVVVVARLQRRRRRRRHLRRRHPVLRCGDGRRERDVLDAVHGLHPRQQVLDGERLAGHRLLQLRHGLAQLLVRQRLERQHVRRAQLAGRTVGCAVVFGGSGGSVAAADGHEIALAQVLPQVLLVFAHLTVRRRVGAGVVAAAAAASSSSAAVAEVEGAGDALDAEVVPARAADVAAVLRHHARERLRLRLGLRVLGQRGKVFGEGGVVEGVSLNLVVEHVFDEGVRLLRCHQRDVGHVEASGLGVGELRHIDEQHKRDGLRSLAAIVRGSRPLPDRPRRPAPPPRLAPSSEGCQHVRPHARRRAVLVAVQREDAPPRQARRHLLEHAGDLLLHLLRARLRQHHERLACADVGPAGVRAVREVTDDGWRPGVLQDVVDAAGELQHSPLVDHAPVGADDDQRGSCAGRGVAEDVGGPVVGTMPHVLRVEGHAVPVAVVLEGGPHGHLVVVGVVRDVGDGDDLEVVEPLRHPSAVEACKRLREAFADVARVRPEEDAQRLPL